MSTILEAYQETLANEAKIVFTPEFEDISRQVMSILEGGFKKAELKITADQKKLAKDIMSGLKAAGYDKSAIDDIRDDIETAMDDMALERLMKMLFPKV
jgi:hypothetical protein